MEIKYVKYFPSFVNKSKNRFNLTLLFDRQILTQLDFNIAKEKMHAFRKKWNCADGPNVNELYSTGSLRREE